MKLMLSSVVLLVVAAGNVPAQDKPGKDRSAKDVRQAVTRSLPYLEKEGIGWWDRRKCNGCHHGGFLLWSHNEAQLRGFDVDLKKLEAWNDRAVKFYLGDLKRYQEKKNGYVEGVSLMLGQVTPPTGEGKLGESFKTTSEVVVLGQHADGFWKYEGQGLKRPDPENNEATTLWTLFALSSVAERDPSFARSRTHALEWLKKTPAGPSNEALVLRILLEDRFGDNAQAKKLVAELKTKQNPDGGWSWTKDRPSEAFATGQSLYALGSLGHADDDVHVQRAWNFLLDKQKEDGSWYNPTRKPNGTDNGVAPYWGTAWATIGLVKTLPIEKK